MGFEIGANRFSIIFCIRNSNLFLKKIYARHREKQSNLKIHESAGTKIILQEVNQKIKRWAKQDMSNFDFDPLTLDPALFLAKNSPNMAKSNPIFPRKRR